MGHARADAGALQAWVASHKRTWRAVICTWAVMGLLFLLLRGSFTQQGTGVSGEGAAPLASQDRQPCASVPSPGLGGARSGCWQQADLCIPAGVAAWTAGSPSGRHGHASMHAMQPLACSLRRRPALLRRRGRRAAGARPGAGRLDRLPGAAAARPGARAAAGRVHHDGRLLGHELRRRHRHSVPPPRPRAPALCSRGAVVPRLWRPHRQGLQAAPLLPSS